MGGLIISILSGFGVVNIPYNNFSILDKKTLKI